MNTDSKYYLSKYTSSSFDISKIVHDISFTKENKEKEKWVFKRRTDRLLLLHLAGAGTLEPLPPRHQLERLDKEGSPGEAARACLQTLAMNTKPSILVERLRYTRRGADWSLLSRLRPVPDQRLLSPCPPNLPPGP